MLSVFLIGCRFKWRKCPENSRKGQGEALTRALSAFRLAHLEEMQKTFACNL